MINLTISILLLASAYAFLQRDQPEDGICTTIVRFGEHWIHSGEVPRGLEFGVVSDHVTWDGTCRAERDNNYIATLSNGWQASFSERPCEVILDYVGYCPEKPESCHTQITHGTDWDPALSGEENRAFGIQYTQCTDALDRLVFPGNCPDPGILVEGNHYYMICTSVSTHPGTGAPVLPIRASSDLKDWELVQNVFDEGNRISWSSGPHLWAPEIHKVGGRYAVYFSASTEQCLFEGRKRERPCNFSIGVAFSDSIGGNFGPAKELKEGSRPGLIDAHFFKSSDGTNYLLWKVDGNNLQAGGDGNTPIRIQQLNAMGDELVGSERTLLINTSASAPEWEKKLIEAPWLVEYEGMFYLFYSAGYYGNGSYKVGVARAGSLHDCFEKEQSPGEECFERRPSGQPMLETVDDVWIGPGHGSVVVGPDGNSVHIHHAWLFRPRSLNPYGRWVLYHRVEWQDQWPVFIGSP